MIRDNNAMMSEAALSEQSVARDIRMPIEPGLSVEPALSIEHWAANRAHQIVVHQGMSLVESAQCLDHKRTNANTHALRKAIMECLVEAMTSTGASERQMLMAAE